MAYTTIDDPTIFFNTVLYTGDGNASQAITGVGFQPDWNWIKARSAGNAHVLQDVVRGISGSKYRFLQTQGNDAEGTSSDNDGVSSLDSDGFTVGYSNSGGWNENAITYAAWNWKAGGTASSNTDGSITSSVSANQTAGFSIVTATAPTGFGNYTVGHGLSSAPEMVWSKGRDSASYWAVFASPVTDTNRKYLQLQLTNALATSGGDMWGAALPTSSVVGLSAANSSPANESFVLYCFHSVKGYSKIGKFTGNGNANGTFVHLGFRPAWVFVKKTSATGHWVLIDNKRDPFNVTSKYLLPDNATEEYSFTDRDLLSNGFKMRNSNTDRNASGATYIYMAFAESPFVNSKGVPNNAR